MLTVDIPHIPIQQEDQSFAVPEPHKPVEFQ